MKQNVIIFLLMMFSLGTMSQTKEEKSVAQAVEKLKKAMLDGDKKALESLASDQLSYGHSAGYVEDKKEFIDKLVTGKSDFVTMNLTDQTIRISDNNAIVRHKLDAITKDNGKDGEAHLLVLTVWQKKGGQWKLLARQAVKQPVQQ